MNGYHCPEPTVVYDPALDILEIRNGEASVTSEEFARGVVVYYDKDDAQETEEPAFAVAVRFGGCREDAEAVCGGDFAAAQV